MTVRAVNICDLTKYATDNPLMSPVMLILKPVLTQDVVHCEGDRWDGDAFLVKEEIDDERWTAIKQILRDGIGRLSAIPKHELRIYESGKSTNKTWRRV